MSHDNYVILDPSMDYNFGSFYLKGLYQIFGKSRIKFKSKPFKQFKHNNHFMALIMNIQNNEYNIIIDFADSSEILEKPYEWCVIYAKVNLKEIDKNRKKIIPIGPGFAIKINNYISTLYLLLTNMIKAYSRIDNKKRFVQDYYSNAKHRLSIEFYEKNLEIKNYIFFISSIWKKNIQTNIYRNNFLLACEKIKQISLNGAFAPRTDNFKLNEVKKIRNKGLSIKEYTEGFLKSFIVFNTPSVMDCHGWKLGEYCAMSKAIISTPLSRIMPGDFLQNKHYLLTNGDIDDIQEKIEELTQNDELRMLLKNNISEYYQRYLKPEAVILEILAKTYKS